MQIPPEDAGRRIDNILITHYKGVPKSRVYRAIRSGEVRINGKRIKAEYKVQAGDEVRLPPLRQAVKKSQLKPKAELLDGLAQRIVYQDPHILVINKPHGIPVHGGTKVSLGLIEALRALYPELKHLELAHRLDKATSGLLIVAKDRATLKELHDLFRQGKVEKHYLAWVKGKFPRKQQTVEVPLRKNTLKSGERMVIVAKDGKAAKTVFKPLEREEQKSLIEAILYTGRTHQIRVHLQHLGFPIIGDPRYGDKDFNREMKQQGMQRMFLHSAYLKFQLSYMDEPLTLKSNLQP